MVGSFLIAEWSKKKTVGRGGTSSVIYVPKRFAGYAAKIIVPGKNGSIDEIIPKRVGRGKYCGVIYVHNRHLGKTVTIVIPAQGRREESG